MYMEAFQSRPLSDLSSLGELVAIYQSSRRLVNKKHFSSGEFGEKGKFQDLLLNVLTNHSRLSFSDMNCKFMSRKTKAFCPMRFNAP